MRARMMKETYFFERSDGCRNIIKLACSMVGYYDTSCSILDSKTCYLVGIKEHEIWINILIWSILWVMR